MRRIRVLITVIIMLIGSGKLFAQDKLACSDFRTGTFKLVDDTVDYEGIIVRDENFQIETTVSDNSKSKYKVEWIDDCTYTLLLVESDKEVNAIFFEKKLIVTITQIEGNTYLYDSKLEGIDFVVSHSMEKVEL